MTVKDVENDIRKIIRVIDDNESAHGLEDDLHKKVLAAIANGSDNASELAKAALKTQDLDFLRWYA